MGYDTWDSHDAELMHYGKKGMRWGYRKAHRARLEMTKKRLGKVSGGNASAVRKVLATGGDVSIKDIVASKGSVTKGAKRAEARNQAAIDRFESGKLKVRDYVDIYGNLPVARIRAEKGEPLHG